MPLIIFECLRLFGLNNQSWPKYVPDRWCMNGKWKQNHTDWTVQQIQPCQQINQPKISMDGVESRHRETRVQTHWKRFSDGKNVRSFCTSAFVLHSAASVWFFPPIFATFGEIVFVPHFYFTSHDWASCHSGFCRIARQCPLEPAERVLCVEWNESAAVIKNSAHSVSFFIFINSFCVKSDSVLCSLAFLERFQSLWHFQPIKNKTSLDRKGQWPLLLAAFKHT